MDVFYVVRRVNARCDLHHTQSGGLESNIIMITQSHRLPVGYVRTSDL